LNAIDWLMAQNEIDADIIFIDPPFDQIDLLEQSLQLLLSKIKRNYSPIIYVESSSKLENVRFLQCINGWVVEKELVAGAVRANLLKLDKQ
jgi:16S rRNA (guanine966-N2)-methyltransferase